MENNFQKNIVLFGLSGSGKSLISVACALELVIEQKKYNKVEG